VGRERARINHGEAVVWPAEEVHGAYTDGSEMRAIVVELRGADDAWVHDILELASGAPEGGPDSRSGVTPAEGRLAPRIPRPEDHDPSTGEPW
jgi:hypothetical protein